MASCDMPGPPEQPAAIKSEATDEQDASNATRAAPPLLCYQWHNVMRASCKKGCTGRILQAIKRMGRLGRKPQLSGKGKPIYKEPGRLYLSIDEGTMHVSARHFR